MKSLLTKIISVLTIGAIAFTFCACETQVVRDENCDDGHLFVDCSYTAPTCKTNGEKVEKCSRCGYIETEVLLPVNHKYEIKSTNPSTCSTHGSQIFECSMCHDLKSDFLLLEDHDYILISNTPPTCASLGSKSYECSVCHKTYSEELPLVEHTLKPINTTASCFNDGIAGKECDFCKHLQIEKREPMRVHDFSYSDYCSECGIYKYFSDEKTIDCKYHYGTNSVGIEGNLVPTFKDTEKAIPIEYWENHAITITISLINDNFVVVKSYTYQSSIIRNGEQSALTIQYYGENALPNFKYANQFFISQSSNYLGSRVHIMQIDFSCDGCETLSWREVIR